jgi:Rps23 Pro-64 3,4-dihydroxylase Tpa1-like proline 4-hydroxylase
VEYFLSEQEMKRLTASNQIEAFNKKYLSADPFPHIVLDDLFDDEKLFEVVEHFPDPGDTQWWRYDNVLERKLAKDDVSELHHSIRGLINELQERRFVQFLERLTGISGLITDHSLNGGGLHQIIRGGKLDIHADYNYHPISRLDRRLNVLLYLNEQWSADWGGNLELWDKDMSRCVKSIRPLFNRLVVFSTTDTAYHGHPDPLQCPEHESRKSIALYYYTNGRPEHERSLPHSTIFKRRPLDPVIEEYEELRHKRAIRRVST